MTERLPSPDRRESPELNKAQAATLEALCTRFSVPYSAKDYWLRPADYFDLPGWATGWIGGDEQEGKTIYVGVSPTGEAHS